MGARPGRPRAQSMCSSPTSVLLYPFCLVYGGGNAQASKGAPGEIPHASPPQRRENPSALSSKGSHQEKHPRGRHAERPGGCNDVSVHTTHHPTQSPRGHQEGSQSRWESRGLQACLWEWPQVFPVLCCSLKWTALEVTRIVPPSLPVQAKALVGPQVRAHTKKASGLDKGWWGPGRPASWLGSSTPTACRRPGVAQSPGPLWVLV